MRTRLLLVPILLVSAAAASSAQNTQPQSGFGSALAIAGSDVIVAEPLNERVPGSVYIFRRGDDGNWTEVQELTADDGHPADRFGATLTRQANRLFVAATRSNEARGAVYQFDRDAGGVWSQTAKITPRGATPGDRFGAAVAVADQRLFVSSTPFESVGKVYVFEMSVEGGWTQSATIVGKLGDGNSFGTSLLASPDGFLVSAPANGYGVVYEYDLETESSTWSRASRLAGRTTASGEAQNTSGNDQFGQNMALADNRLFVSAVGFDGSSGGVYVFDRAGDDWMLTSRLGPFEIVGAPLFGASVATAGHDVLIGSTGLDGFDGGFLVARFDPESGVFESLTKVKTDLPSFTFFGGNIAAEDDLAVVSATNDRFAYGSAVVFERDSASGNWVGSAKLASDRKEFDPSVAGELIKCEDGEARQYSCSHIDLVSFVSNSDLGIEDGNKTNDLWGWSDEEEGREYAIVARTDGVTFVDVTDPYHPTVLGTLPRTPGTPPTSWRDVKVYKHYALIVADNAGRHGVQIFDLTELRNVESPPATFEATTVYDRVHSAHNIVVNEQTGFAYVVGAGDGGETCGGASHIIDLTDPTDPTFAGCFAHEGTGLQGTGYTHDAQCVVYRGPDERFTGREICFAANENAISIADLTDKKEPKVLAKGDYPNPGYTHQGWLTEDQRFFFVGDELDEINGQTSGTRTLVWDVAELDDPILINQHVSANKATDHNLYIRGHYMYQSNYSSGLRVVDIADAENPVEVGYFDTVSWTADRSGYGGSWSNYPFFKSGVIAVTSADEGVFFVKRSDVEF